MSIVIACATKERVVMKSDGREVDSQDHIVSEHCPKMQRLTDECAIGYTGTKQFCEYVIERFNHLCVQNNPISSIRSLQKIILDTHYNEPCAFILTGILNQCVYMFAMSHEDNYKIQNKSPYTEPTSIITISAIGCDEVNTLHFVDYYDTSLSIEMNMNNYIRMIASINTHVNDAIKTIKFRI